MRSAAFVGVSLLLCIMAVTPRAMAEAGGVWFGAWTQIWPWMWRGGLSMKAAPALEQGQWFRWRFAVANLRRYAHSGFAWNLVVLRQGKDGPDGWRRARAIVEAQRRLGIQTLFRLIEDPEIYRVAAEDRKQIDSLLLEYERWVRSLAAEFKGEVKYYAISNEIDHDFSANLLRRHKRVMAEYGRYRRLLGLAYRAIKQEDPEARVMDHGVSAYTLGLAVANELWRTEGLRAAFEFWKKFNFHRVGNMELVRFLRLLSRSDSKRRIRIANETFEVHCDCDFHQLHWYFNPDALQDVLEWIKARSAVKGARPLILTELGYRMPTQKGKGWDGRDMNVADFSRYSQTEHAASLVKAVALLVGYGVRHIQYWQLRVHHERDASAQLYMPAQEVDDFVPTKALGAYERMVQLLSAPLKSSGCKILQDLTDCMMRRARDTVHIAWAHGEEAVLNLGRPAAAQFDYMGREVAKSDGKEVRLLQRPGIFLVRDAVAR